MAEEIRFVLGFEVLAKMLEEELGKLIPLENEHPDIENPANQIQPVQLPSGAVGLMVWRSADNWTAFTNGYETWINGPEGLQKRLNTDRFQWELQFPLALPAPIIETWKSPNCWSGRPFGPPLAIVIHTTAGEEEAVESWFTNPRAYVSAHACINLDSDVDFYVDVEDRAWANGVIESGSGWWKIYKGQWDGFRENPNNWTLSIETEDGGDPKTPVDRKMFDNTLWLCRDWMKRYPSVKYLTSHHVISPRSRPNCCGGRWIASGKLSQMAEKTGLELVL
jgi:hypothetical protein